jgi:uncharacterized membrane protein YbhN (UPF0104 family)
LTDDASNQGQGSRHLGAWIVGVIVSGVFLGGLLWLAEPGEVWAVVSTAELRPLGLAAACYAVAVVARWFRLFAFQDSAPTTKGRSELLWVSAGHSFATQLLPARIGELAFPSLWNRATDQSHADGLVALLAIRLVELAVLAPMYGVALFIWLTIGPMQSDSALAGWLPWVATAAGFALLVALPLLLHKAVSAAAWLIENTPLGRWEIARPLRTAVPDARNAVERIGTRNLLWIALWTAVMWAGLFGVYGYSLDACGAGLGWVQTIVGSGGGIVGNLLPVGAIGSLGVMEAGWTAAFRATGAPLEPVVAAGLLVHAIVIAGAGIATALGYLAGRLAADSGSGSI